MIKHEQPTNDIRKKEEEVARWKATVAPQTEYLCETMDKLDFSSALSASVAVVKSMDEYNTNRISYEVYAVIKDMEFDEKIIPYRINVALNMDVINAQPYKAAYMQNIVDAIRMVFNNHMKNKVTFAKIEKRRGISAYFRYVKEAISVTSQIIRQGHYKDTAGDFKIVVKKKDSIKLVIDSETNPKDIVNCIDNIKKAQKNTSNKPTTEKPKNQTVH